MIERRSLMAGLLAGAATTGFGLTAATEAQAARRTASTANPQYALPSVPLGNGLIFFGGCIRLESMVEGAYIHGNDVHHPVGLSSVSVLSDGDVRVTFDRTVPVVTGFIDEDESFSIANISAGFSGGAGLVNIRFGMNGVRLLPTDSRLWKPNRNLWIGVIGVDA